MTAVDQVLEAIRKAVADLGVDEVARRSGVPITTLYEAKRRNFVGPSVHTLQKLSAVAEQHAREGNSRDAAA